MTILSPPDHPAQPAALAALPDLPRNEEGPVFAEPWQAQAFALAVKLSEMGHFTWKEWAATLAGELKAAADRGEPDDGSHYYHCWLSTLERLVVSKGLSQSGELLTCKEAWAEATGALRTVSPWSCSAFDGAPGRERHGCVTGCGGAVTCTEVTKYSVSPKHEVGIHLRCS